MKKIELRSPGDCPFRDWTGRECSIIRGTVWQMDCSKHDEFPEQCPICTEGPVIVSRKVTF